MLFLFIFIFIIYGFHSSPNLRNMGVYEFLNLVNSNPIVLITREGCSRCMNAKRELDASNSNYYEVDIDKNLEVKNFLMNVYGLRLLPGVFFKGAFEPNFYNLPNLIQNYEVSSIKRIIVK